jgi:hypothetical protein
MWGVEKKVSLNFILERNYILSWVAVRKCGIGCLPKTDFTPVFF